MKFTTLKKGFTLIELLVVIAIIGLLSTVVLGTISSAREKAEDARTKAHMTQIRILLEQYYSDYGGYPWPGNPSDGFYCLGGPCSLGGVPGTELPLQEFAIKTESSPSSVAAVAIKIPNFGTTREVDGNSGYSYIPCEDPVESQLANSGFVCSADPNDSSTNIQISSTVGWIDSQNGFRMQTDGVPGGSDYGSDNNSSGGASDWGSTVYGCLDSGASNYNPFANTDDGSCVYNSGDMVYGCTDSTALNYNSSANMDDGSCDYGQNSLIYGCTDSSANNYNFSANTDDGSCTYNVYGCTAPSAINYNPSANVEDGTCEYGSY